ncbi:MAG: hypothetical protein WC816_09025 [Sphingomonas sp.]
MTGAGYSDTPLARKLGLTPGMKAWLSDMPGSVRDELAGPIAALDQAQGPVPGLDFAHLFVTERTALEALLTVLRPTIAPTGMIWVSWPKKASKRPTDITEDVIRAVALPIGLVDVKVCAVDAIWSGLKLMIRRELR